MDTDSLAKNPQNLFNLEKIELTEIWKDKARDLNAFEWLFPFHLDEDKDGKRGLFAV